LQARSQPLDDCASVPTPRWRRCGTREPSAKLACGARRIRPGGSTLAVTGPLRSCLGRVWGNPGTMVRWIGRPLHDPEAKRGRRAVATTLLEELRTRPSGRCWSKSGRSRNVTARRVTWGSRRSRQSEFVPRVVGLTGGQHLFPSQFDGRPTILYAPNWRCVVHVCDGGPFGVPLPKGATLWEGARGLGRSRSGHRSAATSRQRSRQVRVDRRAE
jgi:hypothetical protein